MDINLCSESLKNLASAMLKVQAELTPALKDGHNPFANSHYATLNSVVEASRPILLKHEIWLSQYLAPTENGHLGLITKLIHVPSGEFQASFMVMPLIKNDPQGFGSALTYARRYAWSALIGLLTEDDDDAQAASIINEPQPLDKNTSKTKAAPKTNPQKQPDPTKDLPKLDGINYQTIQAPDGQLCVIATGSTLAKKDILSRTGFKWHPERKIWWRYAV